MKNISVILPIHKLDDTYKEMLQNSVKSVEPFYEDVKLIIVHPQSIYDVIQPLLTTLSQKLEIKCFAHTSNTDFCTQINKGIEQCDTEWFTILEVDDEYKPVWIKSMNEYIKAYSDVDVFLPVVKDINVEGKMLTFTNESNWAYGFTQVQGFLDNEALIEFQNYQISGALYRTKIVKENGLLKDNIKLTFGYEFLLRLTHNNAKIMTVPKIGYQHVNFREDSLFWSYKNDESVKLSEDEVKFWLESARKEFFFKNKRDIEYNPA
jgi:glycosyltransferase involved in cell wall biosynthesis